MRPALEQNTLAGQKESVTKSTDSSTFIGMDDAVYKKKVNFATLIGIILNNNEECKNSFTNLIHHYIGDNGRVHQWSIKGTPGPD